MIHFGSFDPDWIFSIHYQFINSLDMSEQKYNEHLGDFSPCIISFVITQKTFSNATSLTKMEPRH